MQVLRLRRMAAFQNVKVLGRDCFQPDLAVKSYGARSTSAASFWNAEPIRRALEAARPRSDKPLSESRSGLGHAARLA
jgi:hypothetical protein